jgi:hypothetical protein
MSEYYSETDPRKVEPHFSKHMNAMTAESLESKGDIAIELAVRDTEIERLRKKAGQRGARMQIMARFLRRSPEWWVMVDQHPDAPDWFDADGVPK